MTFLANYELERRRNVQRRKCCFAQQNQLPNHVNDAVSKRHAREFIVNDRMINVRHQIRSHGRTKPLASETQHQIVQPCLCDHHCNAHKDGGTLSRELPIRDSSRIPGFERAGQTHHSPTQLGALSMCRTSTWFWLRPPTTARQRWLQV